MFELSVVVRNQAILRRLIDKLARKDSLVQRITRQVRDEYEPRIKAALAKEPPPAAKPIEWTSEAQRITVLAILRKAAERTGSSTYIRTHNLSTGYLVEIVPGDKTNQFAIQITNDMRYHVYVKWKWQQRFHAKTGWTRDDVVLKGIQEEMAKSFGDKATVAFQEID